jgi:hypothetical protein
MSVMDTAAGPTTKQSSGPQRFTALYPPTFDSVTNRTYQLVERDSDRIPYALSASGNHTADAMLSALNDAKLLAHKREQIKDKTGAGADSERERIKVALKALLTVAAERSDRVTRMLLLYGESEA